MRTNRSSRVVRTITAGVAFALFAGQGFATAGEHRGDPDSRVEPVASEEAWRADAEIVAEATGWSVEEALERAQLQDRLGEVAEYAARKHPKLFTAGIMPAKPGAPGLLRFKGEVPKDVVALADELRVDVEFDASARFSDAELNDRAAKIRDVLAEQGYRDVITAISPEGTVEVQVGGQEGEPKLPRELQENTELTVLTNNEVILEHDRGGARVRRVDANGNVLGNCTAGWAVRSTSTGTRGVTTAGHCTGINQYVEPILGTTFTLTHVTQHVGSLGDVEWKTSAHISPAEFWATATQLREVNSIESWWGFLFGGTYCVYGRSSNLRACDQLYRRNVTAQFPGQANPTGSMHAMTTDNTVPGDSGGGWSFNNEAAGGHIGDIGLDGATRNVFSQARLFPSAIGVEVLTQ